MWTFEVFKRKNSETCWLLFKFKSLLGWKLVFNKNVYEKILRSEISQEAFSVLIGKYTVKWIVLIEESFLAIELCSFAKKGFCNWYSISNKKRFKKLN